MKIPQEILSMILKLKTRRWIRERFDLVRKELEAKLKEKMERHILDREEYEDEEEEDRGDNVVHRIGKYVLGYFWQDDRISFVMTSEEMIRKHERHMTARINIDFSY